MAMYVNDPATGYATALDLAVSTVIKTGPGIIARVTILNGGSTLGFVNDVATVGAATTSNAIAAIPIATNGGAAGTVLTLQMPFFVGLVIILGTSSQVSVSYS